MKPSIDYNAKDWLPNNVKALFIAEAPWYHSIKKPLNTDGYFYNPHESIRFLSSRDPLQGPLWYNIFSLLNIEEEIPKAEKIKKFKELNCYFIEVIKCRVSRFPSRKILNKTIKNCSFYLQEELEKINFENLVVLGERALYSIKNCSPYASVIPDMSLLQLMEQMRNKPMQLTQCKLFVLPLPLWHNQVYLNNIYATFQNIRKELGIT
jgi:hypothetical protein